MRTLVKNISTASKNQRGSLTLALPLVIALMMGLMSWSRTELRSSTAEKLELISKNRTPLYLPSSEKVKLITLGFNNFAADILWFSTLNYFGKQYGAKEDLKWFAHMCDLVSSLDPKAEHVYEFCATLSSWVAKRPEESAKLLKKAIATRPDYWRYHYLLGFTEWYFLDRKDLAQERFAHASKLPDAPTFLASLATRLMVTEDSPDTAIAFLKDLLEHSNDETAKAAFQEKLNLAYISRDLRYLQRLCEKYREEYNAYPESMRTLVEKKMLRGMPLDPFKSPYTLTQGSCEAKTTSGRKGLEFFGKTAKTGLAKNG